MKPDNLSKRIQDVLNSEVYFHMHQKNWTGKNLPNEIEPAVLKRVISFGYKFMDDYAA
jgi:hypothetical protein